MRGAEHVDNYACGASCSHLIQLACRGSLLRHDDRVGEQDGSPSISLCRPRRAGLARTGIATGIASNAVAYAFTVIALAPTTPEASPRHLAWAAPEGDDTLDQPGCRGCGIRQRRPHLRQHRAPAKRSGRGTADIDCRVRATGARPVGRHCGVRAGADGGARRKLAGVAGCDDGCGHAHDAGRNHPRAPLLPGAQVAYSTSSDLQEFSLTLVGPLGAIASYESTTGTLSSTVRNVPAGHRLTPRDARCAIP